MPLQQHHLASDVLVSHLADSNSDLSVDSLKTRERALEEGCASKEMFLIIIKRNQNPLGFGAA